MARKTATYTVEAEGRDQGRTYYITEMSASAAERWARRLFMAAARSGRDIPVGIMAAGMAGVAAIGFQALASASGPDMDVLMDEMFQCIQFIPDPARPQVKRALIEDDIEEVRTRLQLRSEVFELHTGFSMAAALSRAARPSPQPDPTSTTIPTSADPSEPS
nr:hypothetical protein [uncultured Lichenicoccus sp.]